MVSDWSPQPAATPIIAPTEAQALTALRAFLLGVLPAGTDVIQGQANRVAEPKGDDFAVFWPLAQERLETNEVTYYDDVVTASIAGAVLTVTAAAKLPTPLAAGTLLIDDGYPAMRVALGTLVGAQISGSVGGTGTYAVSPPQSVASETMYAGTRADLAAVRMTVQVDVHGPRSGDNVRVIETLFRSEYGTSAFAASGFEVAPLYAEGPRQLPFQNENQQVENRWSLDLSIQVNPVVKTPQQFAQEVHIDLVEADAL